MCTVRSSASMPAASSQSRMERSSRWLPSLGICSVSADVVARRSGAALRRPRSYAAGSAKRSRTCPPGMSRFSSSAVPSASDLAVVEYGDAVGELVGLVQVLGGEEDGDAVGDQLADGLPRVVAAARVEAGGRLVEEDDPRVADQRHGDVEAALHAAGVGGGGLLGGLDQVEALQQLGGDAAALAAGEVVQVRHEEHVLLAGDQTVDGGELSGDADRGADRLGVGGQVVAADVQPGRVGGDEGGEDVDGGGLAGAVRAEQGEDRPFGDGQVDAVEHDLVAVGLAQPVRRDGQVGHDGCSFTGCGR